MEEKEKYLSPEESMRLIESMINRVKDRFNEDGRLYLFWGWLIFLCSTAEFVLYHFLKYDKHYLVWSVSWVALVYQLIYFYKKRRKARVGTYTGHIIRYVWLTYVILSFLIGFLIGKLGNGGSGSYFYYIFSIVLALYGMPLFLCGIIIRFRPLVYGAVCCWALSIITTFIPYDYQMLMLAVAMIAGWIVPGYLLQARHKKEN
ncbi:MAG TPA: hypothetical protein VHB48_00250 [Chitinophagaceae bacterium]|jgi:hypothetical protein|nr:hypothetical protein [Chitinophagaceae bacterium]